MSIKFREIKEAEEAVKLQIEEARQKSEAMLEQIEDEAEQKLAAMKDEIKQMRISRLENARKTAEQSAADIIQSAEDEIRKIVPGEETIRQTAGLLVKDLLEICSKEA